MPFITPVPEQAVAPKLANSWAIDFLAIQLPLVGLPKIHIGITAEMVAEDGARTFVHREEHDVPAELVAGAMGIMTTGTASVYEEIRAGFYQLAQAAGWIPADATYEAPPTN